MSATSVRDRIRSLAVRALPAGGTITGEVRLGKNPEKRTPALPFALVLEIPWQSRTGAPATLRIEERGETLLGAELALLGRLEAMPAR